MACAFRTQYQERETLWLYDYPFESRHRYSIYLVLLGSQAVWLRCALTMIEPFRQAAAHLTKGCICGVTNPQQWNKILQRRSLPYTNHHNSMTFKVRFDAESPSLSMLLNSTDLYWPNCREETEDETSTAEATPSQSDAPTVHDVYQRTKLSSDSLSETWSNPLLSEISPMPLSTKSMLFQSFTTSFTTVSLVPFTPRLFESDLEKDEESELHQPEYVCSLFCPMAEQKLMRFAGQI